MVTLSYYPKRAHPYYVNDYILHHILLHANVLCRNIYQTTKKSLLWRLILDGREKPTLLELFDYIIYEPEMSAELIRDLQEIFSPSNKLKMAQLRVR